MTTTVTTDTNKIIYTAKVPKDATSARLVFGWNIHLSKINVSEKREWLFAKTAILFLSKMAYFLSEAIEIIIQI